MVIFLFSDGLQCFSDALQCELKIMSIFLWLCQTNQLVMDGMKTTQSFVNKHSFAMKFFLSLIVTGIFALQTYASAYMQGNEGLYVPSSEHFFC